MSSSSSSLSRLRSKTAFLPGTFTLLSVFAASTIAPTTAQTRPPSLPAKPGSPIQLAPVAPVDWSKIKASDFADDELDLPYYLAHFHRLANSVISDGPNRGFISLAVWRNRKDNQPYNARIMENVLSLAFFYSTKRPWNPYYGDPATRARLEAALDFWCRSQSPDGRFSEYEPQGYNLAATAFATKFVSQALLLLAKSDAPPLDKAVLDRVTNANRKAIEVVLTAPDFYETGKIFANQYTNVWGGAFAFLELHPDPVLRAKLDARIAQSQRDFQSPTGYFYEKGGPDWSYNLGTHHENLRMALRFTRKTPLEATFLDEEEKFIEWLSYNVVPEPDSKFLVVNRAVETRQKFPALLTEDNIASQTIPLARAFVSSRETIASQIRENRAALEKNWTAQGPQVKPLEVGNFWSFSPYQFLHRTDPQWFPSEAEHQKALAMLPARRAGSFTHTRADSRYSAGYTFVKRPNYYAAFNSGKPATNVQRMGLGLLWNPGWGTVLQGQSAADDLAWGTLSDDKSLCEARTVAAEFWNRAEKRSEIKVQNSNFDWPTGAPEIRYSLRHQNELKGQKTLRFEENELAIQVEHAGDFVEQLPLLLRQSEKLSLEPKRALVSRGAQNFTISFGEGVRAEASETQTEIAGKRLVILRLHAKNRLAYALRFGQ